MKRTRSSARRSGGATRSRLPKPQRGNYLAQAGHRRPRVTASALTPSSRTCCCILAMVPVNIVLLTSMRSLISLNLAYIPRRPGRKARARPRPRCRNGGRRSPGDHTCPAQPDLQRVLCGHKTRQWYCAPSRTLYVYNDGTTVGSTMRMRKYWRRAISRSWILSKWYYRLHGLQLTGRASDAVWYFAYGSNMHEGAFLERRLMRPTEWRVGRLKGYRLRFNLDGVPKGKTAPANVCPDPDSEVWGVLYNITHRQMLRLNLTEGVPGKVYRPTWLEMYDVGGQTVRAMTYVAEGNESDGCPSLRYIALLRDGARAHGLPTKWLQMLESVVHIE